MLIESLRRDEMKLRTVAVHVLEPLLQHGVLFFSFLGRLLTVPTEDARAVLNPSAIPLFVDWLRRSDNHANKTAAGVIKEFLKYGAL